MPLPPQTPAPQTSLSGTPSGTPGGTPSGTPSQDSPPGQTREYDLSLGSRVPARLPRCSEGPWRLEFPFLSRYLKTPGGLMHHVDEGDGEPIVLVHGNPTWSFMYRKVIEAFRERHRVIAFDQLGMGLSERLPKSGERRSLEERIEDFGYFMDNIEGLSDTPVRLVSHDWGGPVALGWAVRNPGRVRSIVLMNTGVRIPPGFRLPWRLAIFKKWGFLGDFLIEKLGLFTKGLLDVGTVRPLSRNAREGLIAPYVKSSLRGSAAGFVRDIPLSEEHPSWETLKSLGLGLPKLNRKPILLVWGMRDFVFGPRFLYDLKKRFPQARVLPLPHSGHWALEDEPQKVLHALRLFWGRAGESP